MYALIMLEGGGSRLNPGEKPRIQIWRRALIYSILLHTEFIPSAYRLGRNDDCSVWASAMDIPQNFLKIS